VAGIVDPFIPGLKPPGYKTLHITAFIGTIYKFVRDNKKLSILLPGNSFHYKDENKKIDYK